mgnify:CR=1 FL=1
MEERQVVTAFLEFGGKIAVFRRSEEVSTYRGRFAGISGTIEGGRTPREQARQEIAEETGLTDKAVLLSIGEVCPVEDEELGIRFMVHPFMFHVASPELELNFEHTEYVWLNPEELSEMETVPDLLITYRAVATAEAFQGAMDRLKQEIASDRTSGALGLAAKGVYCLGISQLLQRFHPDVAQNSFLEDALEIANLRGGMEAIRNGAAQAVLEYHRHDGADLSDRLFSLGMGFRQQKAQAADSAARWIRKQGAQRIFTLSWSASVFETIKRLGPDVEVHVMESSPGGEGTRQAESLAREGIRVTLYPDSAMHVAIRDCQVCLVGTDAVLSTGNFVNKVGSAIAAQLSARIEIPLVVVTESIKLCPSQKWQRETAPWRPVNYEGKNLMIWSEPFEECRGEWVKRYITDSGVETAEEIQMECLNIQSELTRYGIHQAFYGTD